MSRNRVAENRVVRAWLPRDAELPAATTRLLCPLLAGVRGDGAFDVRLLAGEATSNAWKYGRGFNVEVLGAVAPGRASVMLRYHTEWFDPDPPEPPLLAESGRGIRLMRCITAENGGRAVWRFQPAAAASLGLRVTVLLVRCWCAAGSRAQ